MEAHLDTRGNFQTRLKALDRKHTAMGRGYTTKLRDDGLIVVKPRRKGWAISPRVLLLGVFAFFMFKAFVLASLGPATYNDRVDRLAAGTPVEQGGAFVMQVDVITQFLADRIGPVLR